jgi:hypothetical protein
VFRTEGVQRDKALTEGEKRKYDSIGELVTLSSGNLVDLVPLASTRN